MFLSIDSDNLPASKQAAGMGEQGSFAIQGLDTVLDYAIETQ